MNLNHDEVAAFIRGGNAHLVERLRTAARNRLHQLGQKEEGRAFRGNVNGEGINEAAVYKWMKWVDNSPEKAGALKVLKRIAVSASKRLDG